MPKSLDQDRYGVLLRGTRTSVELFREENVPIQTELALLDQKYSQVVGAMTCEFDGETRTMPQMQRYLEDQDRAVREKRLEDDQRKKDAGQGHHGRHLR